MVPNESAIDKSGVFIGLIEFFKWDTSLNNITLLHVFGFDGMPFSCRFLTNAQSLHGENSALFCHFYDQ